MSAKSPAELPLWPTCCTSKCASANAEPAARKCPAGCRFRAEHAGTADLRVEYLKPIRANQEIVVEGFVARREGRQLYHEGEIRNGVGDLLARGRGRFVVIDREKFGTS